MKERINPSEYHLYYGALGRQGKHNFYTTTIKLREVYDTFRFYLEAPVERGDYEVHAAKSGRKKVIRHRDASVDEDVQRIRDPNKVDGIIEYMKKNRENWVFSAITASCDSPILYEPIQEDARIGKIWIRKGSKLLINDGQHRADAIGKIWNGRLLDRVMEDFGDQSMSVVIYEGQNLRRMQQMFIDLQKGTPVNKSLESELSYTIENQLVREVRDAVPFFRNYIVRDQTSVAKGSRKLFTQKSFLDANKYVFGSNPKRQEYEKLKKFLIEFWDTLSKNIVGWEPFLEVGGLDTDEFREDNLSHLSVTMHAFGMIASKFYHQGFSLARLARLKNIDFSRTNSRLFNKYTSNNRLANNPHVRRAIRDYLWEKGLGYSPIEDYE
jgi:DNA sulfur modification protein DndB